MKQYYHGKLRSVHLIQIVCAVLAPRDDDLPLSVVHDDDAREGAVATVQYGGKGRPSLEEIYLLTCAACVW